MPQIPWCGWSERMKTSAFWAKAACRLLLPNLSWIILSSLDVPSWFFCRLRTQVFWVLLHFHHKLTSIFLFSLLLVLHINSSNWLEFNSVLAAASSNCFFRTIHSDLDTSIIDFVSLIRVILIPWKRKYCWAKSFKQNSAVTHCFLTVTW